jgi:hypothetical protein
MGLILYNSNLNCCGKEYFSVKYVYSILNNVNLAIYFYLKYYKKYLYNKKIFYNI